MAKKFKRKIENVKPVYDSTERTISCNGVKINGIVKNVYNEVGHSPYSTLSGTDPNGISLRAITYGTKDPLYIRYEYVQDYNESYDSGQEDYDLSEILGSNFYYEHDRREKNPGKKQVLRYEKKSRPYVTYEEEYFQHIFNWPTSHSMQPRKVGGFVFETNCCDGTTTYYEHSATYPGSTMDLEKVVSELYYIDDSGFQYIYQRSTPFSVIAPIGSPSVPQLYVKKVPVTSAAQLSISGTSLDSADWGPTKPTTVEEAVNRMAALLRSINSGPIP